ncbi:MAG: hypothetical protein ACLFTR_00255 [Candidatus Woesearchaeota archaeon]
MGLGNILRIGKRKPVSIDERLAQILSGETPNDLDDIPREYVEGMMNGFLYSDDLDSLKSLRDAFPRYYPEDWAVDEVYERCKITGESDFAASLYEITGQGPPESTHERQYLGTLDAVLSEENKKKKVILKPQQSRLVEYLARSKEAKDPDEFTLRLLSRHPLNQLYDPDEFEENMKTKAVSDYLKNIKVEKNPAHLKISIYSVTDVVGRCWITAPYDEVNIS